MAHGLKEMVVESVRVHMHSSQHVVILKDVDRDLYLPIWIGVNEADAIARRLQGITPERPLTHDLFATTLEELILWRIVQGAAGAPTVPLAQTILLDTFPPRQHRMVLGIYGMGVVMGPIIGPALGGYLAQYRLFAQPVHTGKLSA